MEKVFLVEDDKALVELYSSVFESEKIPAEVFTFGQPALEKIKEIQDKKSEKPSLFVIDLILPDANGIDILKAIKTSEETKGIPVFILSNYSSPEMPKDGGIKPDKFILKTSISPTELAGLVKEAIK